MLITDLREIIINERPCEQGLAWFDKVSRGHVNTTSFFKSLKKIKHNKSSFTPHCYLRWIFYHCLDWSNFKESTSRSVFGPKYYKFIKEKFHVTFLVDLPVSKLCDALIRAFED
jgi:hypothetical protein